MDNKLKSKWRWRLLRWGLIGLAAIATLAAVLVTEEDWRGKHAWESFRRASEARGERLDLAFVVPPPVPDDQNFFAAPIVASALEPNHKSTDVFNPFESSIYRGDAKKQPQHGGNWRTQTLTDLKEWQIYFQYFDQTAEGKTNGFPVDAQAQSPAADVLLALSGFNPAVEELRQASQRPYARLPLNYENGFEATGDLLPWLAREKRAMQLIQLRTIAEIQAGQSQSALDDIKLSLRLIDSLRNQPFLIAHLVRNAMMNIAVQPVYEGLAQHAWNDAQLAELEAALATQNFLADFQTAMHGERTCAIEYFERQRLTRELKSEAGDDGSQMVTNSLRLMPTAYFYQNELAFARMYEQFLLPLVDLTNHVVSFSHLRAGQQYYQDPANRSWPYKFQAPMSYPSICKSFEGFATAQAAADLARVACALERYKLANGEYPPLLDDLAPRFIDNVPHDVINGQPLHYRRTDDGRFLLYSVGLNEKDDGGTVVLTKQGTVDREKGDWVWQYPAK